MSEGIVKTTTRDLTRNLFVFKYKDIMYYAGDQVIVLKDSIQGTVFKEEFPEILDVEEMVTRNLYGEEFLLLANNRDLKNLLVDVDMDLISALALQGHNVHHIPFNHLTPEQLFLLFDSTNSLRFPFYGHGVIKNFDDEVLSELVRKHPVAYQFIETPSIKVRRAVMESRKDNLPLFYKTTFGLDGLDERVDVPVGTDIDELIEAVLMYPKGFFKLNNPPKELIATMCHNKTLLMEHHSGELSNEVLLVLQNFTGLNLLKQGTDWTKEDAEKMCEINPRNALCNPWFTMEDMIKWASKDTYIFSTIIYFISDDEIINILKEIAEGKGDDFTFFGFRPMTTELALRILEVNPNYIRCFFTPKDEWILKAFELDPHSIDDLAYVNETVIRLRSSYLD